jgi:4-amino-4-deoxy-L-arabinose transferase-like glycosyltransferase
MPLTSLPPATARALVWCAVTAGLAARLAFGLGYWVDKPLTHDEREYLALAASLAAGRGFTYRPLPATNDAGPERFARAPLYPLFLRVVAPGDLDEHRASSPASVKVAQALVGAIGVWLIGWLGTRAAGPAAGLVAAVVAALYPPLVWMPAYVLSETLFSTLALASAALLAAVIDRRAGDLPARGVLPILAAAGAVGGAAALTRPAMVVFLVFAGVWLLVRRAPRQAAAFLAGAAIVILPWSVRNTIEHGRVVLIAAQGGVNLWIGNHPLATGDGDLAANPALKAAHRNFRERHPGLSPEALEPIYVREAIGHVREHPIHWLGLVARKFFYLWVPIGPSYTLRSTRYFVASIVSYGLLLPCAMAGLAVLVRRRAPWRALGLLAASAVLVSLLFFPQERYRIPVIDPALIVCAAACVRKRED